MTLSIKKRGAIPFVCLIVSGGWSNCQCVIVYAEDFTEELLNLHEAEVNTLKSYFEDHKELFEGVTKWQENWAVYLELEVSTSHSWKDCRHLLGDGCSRGLHFSFQRKANDMSRFNNRGGNLLKEEKQRSDLQKSLPKVLCKSSTSTDAWGKLLQKLNA